MHFAVFLLICCLCTAEPQTESDNEIIPHGETNEPQRREPTNASDHQQIYTQDIHAVLREMSALLAEQRVEMKHLQRENEGTVVYKVVREGITVGTTTLSVEVFVILAVHEEQKQL